MRDYLSYNDSLKNKKTTDFAVVLFFLITFVV